MNILLLERIKGLGDLGDEVSVRPGYARNFLLPKGKALRATDANRERFVAEREQLEAAAIEKLQGAEKRAAQLDDLTISILARVAEGDRLYGSVGALEIARTLTELGIDTHRNEVQLPTGALREIGEYEIEVQVHADIKRTITVLIQPD